MSHFSVLVIGDDHKTALQPFHEFECTGTDDQYVLDVDQTVEVQAQIEKDGLTEGLEYFGLEDQIVATEDEVERTDAHKYGYAIVQDGKLVKAVRRTNPNKKWDWYEVGGRYTGRLTLKNGKKANQATADQVDWEGMLAEKATAAAKLYDSVHAIVAGREVTTWDQFIAKHDAGEITIDEARVAYRAQPVIEDLTKAQALDDWYSASELSRVMAATDRERFITHESETNGTLWAMLHDGKWYEPGSMGWFGMSDATDKSTADYATTFWVTVRALPDDTLVTCVDCHI